PDGHHPGPAPRAAALVNAGEAHADQVQRRDEQRIDQKGEVARAEPGDAVRERHLLRGQHLMQDHGVASGTGGDLQPTSKVYTRNSRPTTAATPSLVQGLMSSSAARAT